MKAISCNAMRSSRFSELTASQQPLFDLRFKRQVDEEAFLERERPSYFLASMAALAQVALQGATTQAALNDAFGAPEAVYLGIQGLTGMLLLVVSLSCLLKLNTKWASWCTESCWAVAIAGSMIAGFFQGQGQLWLGLDGCTSDFALSSYVLVLFMSTCCLAVPIRSCFLFPLVVLAMISISLQDFGLACGGALESLAIGHRLLNVVLTVVLLSSSYLSAYRSESYQRKQWIKSTMKERLTRRVSDPSCTVQSGVAEGLKLLQDFLQGEFRLLLTRGLPYQQWLN